MSSPVLRAGIVLFGASARRGGIEFLSALEPSAVRRAYRAIAIASHPDATRRTRRGIPDGRVFVEASRAYETLMEWLLRGQGTPGPIARAARGEHPRGEGRGAEAPQGGSARAAKPRPQRRRAERERAAGARAAGGTTPLFYRGAVPRRRLRLAEYLYYTGRVSWQSMVKAIVWQRSVRPRFGEIARELSRISNKDLWMILGSKLGGERIGAAAQRLRVLSAGEVDRILLLQRLRCRKIGTYFVEEERMASEVLNALLRELRRHNARCAEALQG